MAKLKEKPGKAKEKLGEGENPPGGTGENPPDSPQENLLEKGQVDVDREWRCLYLLCYGTLNYKQAQSAGPLGKLKDEGSPGEKQDSSRGGPGITADNNIRITITLPAIDLARFNMARGTSESG